MPTCTTSWRTCRRFAEGRSPEGLRHMMWRRASALRVFAVALACGVLVTAQGLDWPTYHGDYSGQRHSRLTQITPDNVRQLTLAWSFQTGQTQQIKASPILVDGVIYITTPDNIWALDARSARQVWHYGYPANEGFHI